MRKKKKKLKNGKYFIFGCGPIVIVFIFLILILSIVLGNIVSLLAGEKEAKNQNPEVAFPTDFFYLYREVEKEYNVPWALIAAVHFVQTGLSSGNGWFGIYRDAFDLPDSFWGMWQTSREEYYRYKQMIETGEEIPEDYEPITPNRTLVGDIVFTVGRSFKGVNMSDYKVVDAKLNAITGNDKVKTEQAKLFFWLFNSMFGRPGWPVAEQYGTDYVTSYYGYRYDPFTGEYKFHGGIDIAPPEGENVFAFADGKVVQVVKNNESYGNYVVIEHDSYEGPYGTQTIRTLYAHNQEVIVEKGMEVVGGQKIAEIGSTGRSTGPHLHFEIQVYQGLLSGWEKVDPWPYLIPPEATDNIGGEGSE